MTTYEICIAPSMGLSPKRLVQIVLSMDDAREYLASIGNVIAFEIDCENDDCADAAVVHNSNAYMEIYTIERAS
jgi:hypothetical protein